MNASRLICILAKLNLSGLLLLFIWVSKAASSEPMPEPFLSIPTGSAITSKHKRICWTRNDTWLQSTGDGHIDCFDLSGTRRWRVEIGQIIHWSLSSDARTLIVTEERGGGLKLSRSVCAIGCQSGQIEWSLDHDSIARLVGRPSYLVSAAGLSPLDGSLVVLGYARERGKHGVIISLVRNSVESWFCIDPLLANVTFHSTNGLCISYSSNGYKVGAFSPLADNFVKSFEISSAKAVKVLISGVLYRPRDAIVYAIDNGWGTAQLVIRTENNNDHKAFLTERSHIRFDAHFPSRRVAVGGLDGGVWIYDFSGEMIAHGAHIFEACDALQFSPDGNSLCWLGESKTRIFSMEKIKVEE